MAEIAVRSKAKLGWAKTGQGMESSSEEEDAVVPGVNRAGAGNMRPKHRPRRSREVRPKPQTSSNQLAVQPANQPTVKPSAVEDVPSTTATTLSVHDLSQSLDERRLQPSGGGRRTSVSLKDLCVEDKQRIANLIKELAKVGEEREKAREDLDKERRSYEQQILKLVEQQEQILQERQEVEKHLLECQQLLAQSQQFQHQALPPPPSSSLLSLPPPLIPSSAAPPPPSIPPSSHPQWAWSVGEGRGQDVNHSLFGNVGSPGRHPWAGETEGHHHAHHQAPSATTTPALMLPMQPHPSHPSSAPFPHTTTRSDSAPHQQQSHPHQQHSKQLHQSPHQHPNQVHQTPHHYPSHREEPPTHTHKEQSPVDFFAKAMQHPEPFDVFTPKDSHLPLQSSKEEVIQRFFASQPVEEEVALISPERRSCDGQKSSKTKSSKHGVFLKPVMSSTQKSMEIRSYLSMDSQHGYVPLVPDESSTKSLIDGDGGGGRREEEKRGDANRVMFLEGGNGEPRKHSPFGDSGDDPHAYRKMSQTQRKEQLLQQRTQLLEEQQRLKHVLTEQENMLREKQHALQTRSRQHQHHRHHLQDAEDDGNEPDAEDPLGLVPQRLAIDAALERQRAIVDSLELEAKQRNAISKSTTTTNIATTTAATTTTTTANLLQKQGAGRRERDGGGGRQKEKERRRGKKEVGGETFVVATNPLSDIVRKLDYSLHSDSEEKLEDLENSEEEEECNEDDGEEEEDEEETAREEEEDIPPSTPEKQDVGTSVSYRTIPRSSFNPRETAPVDRRIMTDLPLSASHPSPSRTSVSPGEKTMSVLEIINSLPSPRTTVITHKSQNLFSRPHDADLPPFSHWRENKGGDDDVEIVVMDSSEEEEEAEYDENEDADVGNEALEESQILEDIFFLK